MWRADSLEKTLMLGKIEGRDEKGVTEDEMVRWHHQLKGHEFEQTQGDGNRQGDLACCSPRGCKEQTQLSGWKTIWLLWVELLLHVWEAELKWKEPGFWAVRYTILSISCPWLGTTPRLHAGPVASRHYILESSIFSGYLMFKHCDAVICYWQILIFYDIRMIFFFFFYPSSEVWSESHSVVFDSLQPHGL